MLGTEHAWNRVGDKYIDITAELVLEKNIAEEHYVQLMTMDAKEVTDMVLEEDCYTWLFGVKYANELKNKKVLVKIKNFAKNILLFVKKSVTLYQKS